MWKSWEEGAHQANVSSTHTQTTHAECFHLSLIGKFFGKEISGSFLLNFNIRCQFLVGQLRRSFSIWRNFCNDIVRLRFVHFMFSRLLFRLFAGRQVVIVVVYWPFNAGLNSAVQFTRRSQTFAISFRLSPRNSIEMGEKRTNSTMPCNEHSLECLEWLCRIFAFVSCENNKWKKWNEMNGKTICKIRFWGKDMMAISIRRSELGLRICFAVH